VELTQVLPLLDVGLHLALLGIGLKLLFPGLARRKSTPTSKMERPATGTSHEGECEYGDRPYLVSDTNHIFICQRGCGRRKVKRTTGV
jgi:hypothetical protein